MILWVWKTGHFINDGSRPGFPMGAQWGPVDGCVMTPHPIQFSVWNSFVGDVQSPVPWLYFYWSPVIRQWICLVPGSLGRQLPKHFSLASLWVSPWQTFKEEAAPHIIYPPLGPSHGQATGPSCELLEVWRREIWFAGFSDLNCWTGQSYGLFREEACS